MVYLRKLFAGASTVILSEISQKFFLVIFTKDYQGVSPGLPIGIPPEKCPQIAPAVPS